MEFEPEELGTAWSALREMAGLTRDEVYEVTGIPVPYIELIEDFGGYYEIDQIEALAEQAFDCEPGELLDAARFIAEAGQHDIAGEMEDERQADKLLKMLEQHGEVTFEQMRDAGIATGNVPFNVLYDRGLPVEIVREGEPIPALSTHKVASGVRLKADEIAA